MKKLADVVTIRLPNGWRRIESAGGVALVRASDFDACAGDLESVTFFVSIGLTVEPVADLMCSRVPQGKPDTATASVRGAPATRFEYTDGVRRIHSYFIDRLGSPTVELTLATLLDSTGAPRVDLDAATQQAFASIAWR